MIGFITLIILNSTHGSASKTKIKADYVLAMRENGQGCALSYKGIEEEVLTRETCDQVNVLIANSKAKPAKSKKSKAKQGWFDTTKAEHDDEI